MLMRIGCLTYCTSRGLSHLAKSFHAHGLITDVCLVLHPSVPNHPEWYPGAPTVNLRSIDKELVREWARGLDVLFAFETFFDWSLVPWCREHLIKTVLVPMYECFQSAWPYPDKFICPSLLDLRYFPDGVFLPLPVEYPWRLRERAEVYVHNGGYLGIRGREGTEDLIYAMRHVKSPLRLILRCQENVSTAAQRLIAKDKRIDYRPATVPYEELYAEGDVCVGAQKWNGCSLPLQEARASGMLVMNTDRFPMNTWLPKTCEYGEHHDPDNTGLCSKCGYSPSVSNPLIPVSHYVKGRIGGAYLEFDEAVVRPEDIAATMDAWYGRDIASFSVSGREWAEANSWQVLGPKWREALST